MDRFSDWRDLGARLKDSQTITTCGFRRLARNPRRWPQPKVGLLEVQGDLHFAWLIAASIPIEAFFHYEWTGDRDRYGIHLSVIFKTINILGSILLDRSFGDTPRIHGLVLGPAGRGFAPGAHHGKQDNSVQ